MLFICWEESLSATTGHLRLLGLLTCPSVPANTETWGLFPSKEAPNILVLVITQEPCICYFLRGICILSTPWKLHQSFPFTHPKRKTAQPHPFWKLCHAQFTALLWHIQDFPPENQGEHLNHQDIPNAHLSFHSSLESDKEAVLLAWQKAWTESHRQEQRLGMFLPFLPLKCWWSYTSFLCFKH